MDLANSPAPPDAQALATLVEEPLSLEDRDDLAPLVESLPAMTFVALARKLREESRLDLLLPHARPRQLATLLDLEVWERDRVDVSRSREWLHTVTEHRLHEKAKRGALGDLMYDMDPEMWTLSLCHLTAVGVIDQQDEQSRLEILDDMKALVTYETPDGFFIVGVPDNEFGRQGLEIVKRIYEDDLAEGRKLVLSVHSALPSAIEEDLYRWRSGRLADLGFPSREEAMRLFTPLSPSRLLTPEGLPQATLPNDLQDDGIRVVSPQQAPLLSATFDRLSDKERSVRTRELALLANGFLVALGLEPGHEASQHLALRCVAATLNLGLEQIAAQPTPDSQTRPGPDELAQWLPKVGLRALFRVGYGPLSKLRSAVNNLRRQSPVSGGGLFALLDRPWGPSAKALGEFFPMLVDAGAQDKRKPIASLSELALATERLEECKLLLELCFGDKGLRVDPVWIARADDPLAIRVGDLIRAALIHRACQGVTTPFAPLGIEDLSWAAEHCVQEGQVTEEFSQELRSVLRYNQANARSEASISDTLLTRLAVELSSMERAEDGTPRLDRIGGLFTIQSVAMWLKTGIHGIEREN